jgi:hypothetical protein
VFLCTINSDAAMSTFARRVLASWDLKFVSIHSYFKNDRSFVNAIPRHSEVGVKTVVCAELVTSTAADAMSSSW